MTRRSLLVLVTVLGSLLVAALSTPVSAATARYSAAIVPVPFVSTTSGPTVSLRECTHPTFGFPTCYSRQADGLWSREELTLDETGANWVLVGTVPLAEVIAAVGDVNAVAS